MTAYNPAQQQVIDLLGRGEAAPVFAPDLAVRLRDELEEAIAPLVPQLGGEPLWISKHALSSVHGCEANFVASEGTFAWSVPSARGTVAHKAIELSVHWRGDAPPARPGRRGPEPPRRRRSQSRPLPSGARRSRAGPAALRHVRPHVQVPRVLPTATSHLVAGHREQGARRALRRFGRARRQGRPHARPARARRRHQGDHRSEVRAASLPAPPRRPPFLRARFHARASACRPACSPPTSSTRRGPIPKPSPPPCWKRRVRRTAAGVARMVALLRNDETPAVRPGAACRWCPLKTTCPEGMVHLEESGDDGF